MLPPGVLVAGINGGIIAGRGIAGIAAGGRLALGAAAAAGVAGSGRVRRRAGQTRGGGGVEIEAFRFFPQDAAADESFQRAQAAMVLGTDKADGVANGLGPAGAADAVDVVLRVRGKS